MTEDQPTSVVVLNLERLMKAKGWKPKPLSIAAKLGETAVTDILKGRSKNPKIDTLRALAEVLGVEVRELTSDADKEVKAPPPEGLVDRELVRIAIENCYRMFRRRNPGMAPKDFSEAVLDFYDSTIAEMQAEGSYPRPPEDRPPAEGGQD